MNLVLEDYFKEEHYEYEEIATGSRAALLSFFNGPVLGQWPNLMRMLRPLIRYNYVRQTMQ